MPTYAVNTAAVETDRPRGRVYMQSLYYIMLYFIILHSYIISYYIIFCYVILYYVILYYIRVRRGDALGSQGSRTGGHAARQSGATIISGIWKGIYIYIYIYIYIG